MPSVPMQLETLRRIVQEVDAMPSLHEALEKKFRFLKKKTKNKK